MFELELWTQSDVWLGLLSLVALEIVLGIDNIVFIAILTERLPKEQQALGYRLGLGGALITRLGLLLTINWVMQLTTPLFWVFEKPISGRDLILLAGGLFLIGKSVQEMYEKVEKVDDHNAIKGWGSSLGVVVGQIALLDIVFSLDSVITAVGMVKHIEVMVVAVIIAVIVMLVFAKPVGDFVNRHPSMKILALAFLLLVGVLLVAEGLGQHVDKRYVYFGMGFALTIEFINMRFRKKHTPKEPQL